MRHTRPCAILMVSLLAGCLADRPVPEDAFACSSGGVCLDADAGIRDGGSGVNPDGGSKGDAGTPDVGPVGAQCAMVMPLPSNGLASGNNVDEVNKYDSTCFPRGGKDVLYGFRIAGRLRTLRLTLETSSYDTGLQLYKDNCQPVSLVACNDDDVITEALQSDLLLDDVPPGDYAAIVDAYGEDEVGTYFLSVTGVIEPEQPCDPNVTFLECEFGTCTNGLCPKPLDCADGVDDDDDGLVDEDGASCSAPPTVACSARGDLTINGRIEVRGDPTPTQVQSRRWRVTERPLGSVERPDPSDASMAVFIPDLAGSYGLKHVVSDARNQLASCTQTIVPSVFPELRVELIWNPEEPSYVNYRELSLHLLHPTSPAWFDDELDCYAPDCRRSPPDWGANGLEDDPYIIGSRFQLMSGSIDTPEVGGYGVGVHYAYDADLGPARAIVRIHCGGALESEIGPVTIARGDGDDDENDLWKVAEVMWDGMGGCVVMPYGNPPVTPLIVTGAEARMAR